MQVIVVIIKPFKLQYQLAYSVHCSLSNSCLMLLILY